MLEISRNYSKVSDSSSNLQFLQLHNVVDDLTHRLVLIAVVEQLVKDVGRPHEEPGRGGEQAEHDEASSRRVDEQRRLEQRAGLLHHLPEERNRLRFLLRQQLVEDDVVHRVSTVGAAVPPVNVLKDLQRLVVLFLCQQELRRFRQEAEENRNAAAEQRTEKQEEPPDRVVHVDERDEEGDGRDVLKREDEPRDAGAEGERKSHENAGEAQVPRAVLLAVELTEVSVGVGGDA